MTSSMLISNWQVVITYKNQSTHRGLQCVKVQTPQDSSAFHTQAVTHNTWRRQQESHERVSQVILPLLVRSATCNLCWETLKTFWLHSQSQQHTWEGRWGWSFLKTQMTPAWRRGVRHALSHASFKRIHPCDWENHSQFSNLWCGGEGDQRHDILLCEKRGWVSPSIPASGWRGYFLSLKAVCIFDHRTDFLPISPPLTHIIVILFLPPVTCLTLSLLSPSLHCLYPPFQALKLANWHPSNRS